MFNIKLANLVITFNNQYPYVKEKCVDYLTEEENNTGLVYSATKEQMDKSISYKYNFDGEVIDYPEAEYDVLPYGFYKESYPFDAFWLHSVLIAKDNKGYAFTATSGCGKSTHAKLWLQEIPGTEVINGDNTIIRKDADGVLYGYGTPFCGKEGFHKNTRVAMKAVCFIERSERNYVTKLNPMDAIMRLAKENWCLNKKYASMCMSLYMDLAEQVDFYVIHCNMEREAARIAYEEIK